MKEMSRAKNFIRKAKASRRRTPESRYTSRENISMVKRRNWVAGVSLGSTSEQNKRIIILVGHQRHGLPHKHEKLKDLVLTMNKLVGSSRRIEELFKATLPRTFSKCM